LLNQVDLQIRLTFGSSPGPDGSPAAEKLEAFRPDVTVEVGANQQLIVGGRIDPWANQVVPSSIRNVQFGEDTVVLGAEGEPIRLDELESTVLVRVSGYAIERDDGDPYGDRFSYTAELIEVVGGAVTEYRGTVAEVAEDVLRFQAPRPLQVTQHTDIREETGFSIDFFTLSARIRTGGGGCGWRWGPTSVLRARRRCGTCALCGLMSLYPSTYSMTRTRSWPWS